MTTTPGAIRAQLAAHRWQRPCRGVLVTHNGPLSLEQRRWVALLHAPAGSVLSGPTAAALDGLVGFESDIIHVTMPPGRRSRSLEGAAYHWSSRLDTDDVHPLRQPPRTRVQRSILDMASSLPHDRLARAVVLAGVQQRLVTPSQLSEALRRRGPCPRRALIVESIADAGGGIASVPEKDFDAIVHRFGLPAPTRQRVVQRAGRRCYLDVDWETYGIGVEVQGAHHFEILRADADLDRHNEITSMGRRLLMFSSRAVRHDADVVGEVLTQALRSAGWDAAGRQLSP